MKKIYRDTISIACLCISTAGIAVVPGVTFAQGVTPRVPLLDSCEPQPGSFCTQPVIGTSSFKVIKPAVTTNLPNGDLQFVGETAVTFDGRLQVDAFPLTGAGVFPSLLLPALNDQLDVEVATQYNLAYDGTFKVATGQFVYDPKTKFTVNSLTTKKIGVDIRSDAFTFADSSVGKLRLTAIDPKAIVNNATDLAGKFSSTDGKIVFGTITGKARVLSNPDPISLSTGGGTSADFLSPFALAIDVTSTVQTQLDETGLITPKIAVNQGIEMNNSKITGLAAGTTAGDAVNYSQLQAEAAQRAAIGVALQDESSARVAGDQALSSALQSESAKRAAIGDALLDETRSRVAGDLALSNKIGALDSRVSTLTSRIDKQDAKIASSTALAVAMGGAVFLPGMKYNLTANVGTYEGAHAGSIQFGALVSPHVAVNAGVATGFNKGGKTAGRVGFTLGW